MAKKIDYTALLTRRKDGRWQKVVNGKCLTDADPERLMRRVREAENPPPPAPVMFADMADGWSAHHFPRVEYKTAEAYTAPLRRIKEQFGGIPLPEVSPMQIQAYISDLPKRGYARRTVQMHLDIIRMICDFSILQGKAFSNPTAAVTIPSGLHTTKRTLPADEEIEKIENSTDKPFGLFAYFLLYSGLRRGEALALQYSDIDFSRKIIHVNKAVSYESNSPVLKSTKTESGIRDVILLDVLADKLDKDGSGLLFGDNGKLLTKIQFRKRWIKYADASGVTITPHQLRHGFATICYDAEIDEKAAQMLLGHSSIAVTKNVYTHIRQSRINSVADALNKFTSKA